MQLEISLIDKNRLKIRFRLIIVHKGETNSLKMIKADNGKGKGVQHVSLDFERPTLTGEPLAE